MEKQLFTAAKGKNVDQVVMCIEGDADANASEEGFCGCRASTGCTGGWPQCCHQRPWNSIAFSGSGGSCRGDQSTGDWEVIWTLLIMYGRTPIYKARETVILKQSECSWVRRWCQHSSRAWMDSCVQCFLKWSRGHNKTDGSTGSWRQLTQWGRPNLSTCGGW